MTMIANSHLPTSGGGGMDTVPASAPSIRDVMGTVFGPSSAPQGAPVPTQAPGAWPKDAWPEETTPQAQGAAELFSPWDSASIASMPPVSTDPAPNLGWPDSCHPRLQPRPPWADELPPAPCLPPKPTPEPSFPATVQVGQGASGTVGAGFSFSDLFPDY